MKIRWKVLGLLVLTALLPLALVTGVSQVRGRLLGLELAAETRQAVIAAAERELQQRIDGSAALLWQRGEALTLAVRIQAREAERLLTGEEPIDTRRILPASDFDDIDSPGTQLRPGDESHTASGTGDRLGRPTLSHDMLAYHLAPDADADLARTQMRQLAGLRRVFSTLREDLGEHMLWQYVGLESGLHLTYPAHGGFPDDFDPRRRHWYELGSLQSEPSWLAPLVDASTGRVVVPLVAPIRDDRGETVGVTGIDVALTMLLQTAFHPKQWRSLTEVEGEATDPASATDRPQAIVCILRERPDTDKPGLFLWAYEGYETAGVAWDQPIEEEWFVADDPEQQQQLLDDLSAERARLLGGTSPCETTVRRLLYQGREHFWAHRQFDNYPDVLVAVLAPYDMIVAQAHQAERRFHRRFLHQLGVSLGAVLVLSVGIIVVAIVVSREITLPIRKLAATAMRVARGDLQARADVRRGDELGDLARAFNDMLPQLHDRLRLRQSLSLAMEVQQNLLPHEPPSVSGLDIAGQSLYCDETGGDYYDFIKLEHVNHGSLLAAVGDVTGHGVAAALLMTTARALLRSRSALSGDLAQIVTDVNRHLSRDTGQGRFMTLFLLLADCQDRRLHWVSAGHDPAICYDPQADKFTQLAGEDIPLGIDEAWQYRRNQIDFPNTGCVLVIGTDGIWEARSPDGEMYGKDRLRRCIQRHAGLTAEQLSSALTAELAAFVGEGRPQDDATLVIIRFLAESGPEQ